MNVKTIGIVALVIFVVGALWYYRANPLTAKATIRGVTFPIELAITPKERELGLSYRKSLANDHGMLFLFDHEQQYTFWMKGMEFPIDIVWIRSSTIMDITPNVPVAGNPPYPQYTPIVPVDKVLELNAGTVSRYGIAIGDKVTFSD